MAGPAAPMSKNSAPVFCIAADVHVDEKRKKEEEEKKKKHPHSHSKTVGGEKERTGQVKKTGREKKHISSGANNKNIVIIVNTHTETGRTQ